MSTTTYEKQRLMSHFGFKKIPFSKFMRVVAMYNARSQKALKEGLEMWLLVGGLALIPGPTGVGKSMAIRRFVSELDNNQYTVYAVPFPPSTVYGFLRFICRRFGLPMKNHSVDLFDAAQKFLVNHQQERGTHPILILDDAEGLYPDVADVIRRLTTYDLDAEDRFSVLVCGIESLLQVLENLNDFYAQADTEEEMWREFTEMWWACFSDTAKTVSELNAFCEFNDLLQSIRGDGNERSQQIRFSKALKNARERVYNQLQICMTKNTHLKKNLYSLKRLAQEETLTPLASSASDFGIDPFEDRENGCAPIDY